MCVPRRSSLFSAAALTAAFFLTAPAGADWLVTLEGRLIETDGPWTIADGLLTYRDLAGEERSLPLQDVDLEGSEATTAFKQGREYVPPASPSLNPSPADAADDVLDDEPPIILYQTRWCGYCRKARKLLSELDADFVTKDIERDPEAAREYREKGEGYGGVPLIDFDGVIVRGYGDRVIRRLARQVAEKERTEEER